MCCCPCPTSQTKQRMNLIITMEVLELANIKSAKKRILVAEKRAEKNKSVRSRVKTALMLLSLQTIKLLLKLH